MTRFSIQIFRRIATVLLSTIGLGLLLGLSVWSGSNERGGATAQAANHASIMSSMHVTDTHMTDTKSMTHTVSTDGKVAGQKMHEQMQTHMAQMMQMMEMDQVDPVQKGQAVQMMGLMLQMQGLMMQATGRDAMPMGQMGMDDGAGMDGMDMHDDSAMGDMDTEKKDDAGMDGMGMGHMAGAVATGELAPLVRGLYAGEELFFIHTEASDADVAQLLTEMMGPQVVVVPELAETPDNLLADVYVFQNGVAGMGPFGFQPDVFGSVPGDEGYRPLHSIHLVNWMEDADPRLLASVDEVMAAQAEGELMVEEPGIVVNLPILSWPEGSR